MNWFKIFKLKTDPDRENRISRKIAKRYSDWIEIHARWSEMNLAGDTNAVEKTAQEFGCSRQKVLNAISFMIGWGQDGVKGK